jgi:hypothetical protein
MNNTVLNFAHSRIKNSTSELIKTEDIIKGIKLIDEQEKAKNKI